MWHACFIYESSGETQDQLFMLVTWPLSAILRHVIPKFHHSMISLNLSMILPDLWWFEKCLSEHLCSDYFIYIYIVLPRLFCLGVFLFCFVHREKYRKKVQLQCGQWFVRVSWVWRTRCLCVSLEYEAANVDRSWHFKSLLMLNAWGMTWNIRNCMDW